MQEYFDVVDVNDQVIGRQTRDFVHKNKLLHRSVHALVYDQSNRLYLQKRAMTKDTNPGLWDTSMGGHVESGETYSQAVIRETREELGIDLKKVPPRLFKLDACEETGYEFIWVYKINHTGAIQPCEIEIEEGRWLAPEKLNQLIRSRPNQFTSSFKLILTDLE